MLFIRWLKKLIWFLPAGVASLAALLSLAAAAVFAAWLFSSPHHAVGRLIETLPLPGRGVELMALEVVSGGPFRKVVVADTMISPRAPEAGDWVLAYGLQSLPGAQGDILVVSDLVWTGSITTLPSLTDLKGMLRRAPMTALIAGAFFLIAGALLGQHLGAVVLGAILAASTWHAVQVASFHDLIRLPEGGAYPLAVLALVMGLAMGLRAGRNRIADAMQRLVAVVLLVVILPEITPAFGWDRTVALAVALPLTLLSPLTLYVVTGAWLIGIGLSADQKALYVLLAACAICAVVVRALADQDPEARMIHAAHPSDGPRALSLFDLLVRR